MNRFPSSLLVFLVCLTVVSCKKDPVNPVPLQCEMLSAEVIDPSGWNDDMIYYIYTDDKLTRENHKEYYTNLIYTGDKITRLNYFVLGSTTSRQYDKLYYNADGTITKLERYDFDGAWLYRVLEFTYSDNKLIAVTEKSDKSSSPPQPIVVIGQFDFNYTGNNITSCVFKDFLGDTTIIINYQYDNMPNYFSKRKENVISDPFFIGFSCSTLPYRFSENNVIKVEQRGREYNYNYILDDKQNLKEVVVNGELSYRYSNHCH